MRVAVIGAGGSGLAAAHYLGQAGHRVTLLEKSPLLGGNIRTLNQNVEVPGLDPDITLEAGVVEFPATFQCFRALMEELGVPLEPASLGTALFFEDGQSVLSPSMIEKNREGFARLLDRARLLQVVASSAGSMYAAHRAERDGVSGYRGRRVSDFLSDAQRGGVWVKSLIMYSYSIPYAQIGDVPAEMAIPAMRKYMRDAWYRIPDGVYSYVEKILERFEGEVHTGVDIASVARADRGVDVVLKDGRALDFHQVVFACPPDQVLALLSDPSDNERRRFGAWRSNHATTTIHTDDGIYRRHDIQRPSEFDFFQHDDDWGYNAALNGLCGIDGDVHYYLSYNIEPLLDPDRILHRQRHHTPLYTADAFRHRDEVRATNGERNTWHAGAWLGDGLHEGAIAAGKRVADGIGPA